MDINQERVEQIAILKKSQKEAANNENHCNVAMISQLIQGYLNDINRV